MVDIIWEGKGIRDSRKAIVQEVVSLFPEPLFRNGLIVRIGNELWPSGSPRTSMGVVKWDTLDDAFASPAEVPVLQFKTWFWSKRNIPFQVGPDKRIFGISAIGVVAHELWHVGQTLEPSWDERFSDQQKRRWSYARSANAIETEGGPSIISLSFGGRYAELDGETQQDLMAWSLESGGHAARVAALGWS
jgi:hypothetical protein